MRAILILIFVIYGIYCQNLNIVTSVNARRDRTWTAKQNRFTSLPKVHMKKLMGVQENHKNVKLPPPPKSTLVRSTAISSTFDARQKWRRCRTIGTVRDQGLCGSCWAFAAVSSMSDRICIKSNGRINVNISAEHVLSCCTTCGEGCDGGYPKEAWKFWTSNGIVTGGDFNSRVVLLYFIYSLTAYAVGKTVRAIQSEIVSNGPVCAVMCVHEDFMSYDKVSLYDIAKRFFPMTTPGFYYITFKFFMKLIDSKHYSTGVYQHVSGEFLGYHAVKIIGWGTENGIPYWLVVNSWGLGWGIRGLFKIAQNYSENCIEDDVTAGHPKY
ncbi:hypothetical protein J437_LFUL007859 [Ladona fulva]|uniref:Peptidase C1A papain C-terminal domain-containing protein n=1 Tax=Ladona fulva TaxID=123851 RepID=A0A8K0JWT5_LADFU|nr:hypothetical protein J437_LFUL007859 [Ladona fulva]